MSAPSGLIPGKAGGGGLDPGFFVPIVSQATSRSSPKVGAGQTIAVGDLCMGVSGVAYPAKGSTALAGLLNTLSSKMTGADDNGHVYACTQRKVPVKLQFLGGTSKTLGIDSFVYGGSAFEIKLQLGTNGGGTVTTTAAAAADFLSNHARCRDAGLRVAYSGDGTGLCAAQALTTVKLVTLLGWAVNAYDNSGSGSDATVEMTFALGARAMTASGITRATVPGVGAVGNATTVKAAFDTDLDIPIALLDSDGTLVTVRVD